MFKKDLKTALGFTRKKGFRENPSEKTGKEQALSANYDDNLKVLREVFNLDQGPVKPDEGVKRK